MGEPVRNLLVYGDGRVEEVTFRLEGRYFMQAEDLGDGRIRYRRFEGDYASQAKAGPFTMAYLEREEERDDDAYKVSDGVIVNGTPVPVDVPMATRKTVTEIHRECVRSGGHAQETSETCSRCGLSGYVIRAETYRALAEEEERRAIGGLRDQLVALRDECTRLKVENSDLRRSLERRSSERQGDPK
jgi:hypothetical protein